MGKTQNLNINLQKQADIIVAYSDRLKGGDGTGLGNIEAAFFQGPFYVLRVLVMPFNFFADFGQFNYLPAGKFLHATLA